jgi:tetratricopeptide (TPR) repeat protein
VTSPLEINEPSPATLVAQEPGHDQTESADDTLTPSELDGMREAPAQSLAPDAPLSLKIARDMFEAGQYDRAYVVYNQIQQYLPPNDSVTAFYDFLTLHKGLCLTMNQESIQGRRCLSLATQSQIPSIRVMANYHLSALELSQNQFMRARSRACAALALLDALTDQDPQWLAELKQTCCYLVAEATSKQALILCNADKQLPSSLRSTLPLVNDPWYNLDETQIHNSLAKEDGLLASILLRPEFSTDAEKPQMPWSVSCHRMTVGELLARFGAATSMEVVWHDEANLPKLRKQAISLCTRDVSGQTVISLATGSAGLLAQIGDDQVIHVRNPESASLVSQQVAMLAQEGTAMWQRYLFSATDSPYFAIAHFISGLLYQQLSLNAEALSEFKLVSSRYSRSNLAPYALLYSSQVKEALRDAFGVEKDLKQLVEQYPDVPIVTEAFLRLAHTVAQLGDDEEAAKLYRKVYYLNLSQESRVIASLNAGRCFYKIKEYDSAELWLTQYIDMSQNNHAKEFYPAYFTLGQTLLALGKTENACLALRRALKGELNREDYLEAMASLVEGYMQQEDLMEAIDVLENAFNAQLTPSDTLELNILKGRALRSAGFVDRSIELLQNNKGSVSDPTLNAKLSYELSLGLIEKGQLIEAQKELSQTLVKVESGPWAHKIALALAQVCLDLGQESQAVSVCQSVLKLDPEPLLLKHASELLAAAYTNQKNYDKAARALIGPWN